MVEPKIMNQLPNRDHIERLRDLAYYISRLWGREIGERNVCEPDGYGDYREYTLRDCRYRDEKLTIVTTSCFGTSCLGGHVSDDDLVVKIGLTTVRTVVFNCTARALHVYRPGTWEGYLLSMEDAVRADQERIHQCGIQRQEHLRKMEEDRFAPINDRDWF